jgi:biotin carboxyl carrier protein
VKERLKISGKRVELPAANSEWKLTARPGGWILAEGPGGERKRLMVSEVRGRLSVSVGGWLWSGEVARDQRAGSGASAGSDADLVAQFPGKVRKLLVAAGAVVSEGDPLVLVEAMKMEFAVKAPFAGTVMRMLVQEGQQLSPGDRFLDMKPKTETEAGGVNG